jgi:S-DNA-T family DNA segregation ATPase FtsK/SpoIIIE
MKDLLIKLFSVYGFKVDIHHGIESPSVTTYQFNLETGTRLTAVQAVLNDIARDAGLRSIRLVNDKGQLYLEVPNNEQSTILFSDLIKNDTYMHSNQYDLMLGIDSFNNMALTNLRKLPHLLIGGSTGSGKSVGIHMLINSLLAKNKPDTLQLLLIDPKRTELGMYNGLPHLIGEVVTEAETADNALLWLVNEMERRYTLMEQNDTRELMEGEAVILVVIDEMADLIMSGIKDIEKNIIRLAQKARACGIHIIAATQRPSREVVTGLIKANFPARLAYRTASSIDSRVILDSKGAETLLGQGDSLFYNIGVMKRVQAAFISDKYLLELIDLWKGQYKRVNKLVIFEHDNTDMLKKSENINITKNVKKPKRDKVLLALIVFFCYSVYRMIKTGLKVFFAPVRMKRGRR